MRRFVASLGLTFLLLGVLGGLTAARAAGPVAEVRYVITNGGTDVQGKGEVHFFPAGHHDGPQVDWIHSGGTVRIPPGAYDVHVTFVDGDTHKDLWFDNQTLTGSIDRTVEVGVAVANVRYVITNGGTDVQGKGEIHFFPAGHDDGNQVDWIHSGGTVRIPPGAYDVHVIFVDGDVHKDLWFRNQSFSGKVEKTVEVNVAVAVVRYIVTNGGMDVHDKGQVHFFPAGHHDGNQVDWIHSGGTVRMPPGAYDVQVTFTDGFARKRIWLDNQSFAGQVDRTVEMALSLAEPTVAVTVDGADIGDKATIAYIDGARNEVLGSVRSGQPALLEAGTYDIHATLAGAEGWLRKIALTGKPRLTIPLKPRVTQVLQAAGPPPTACTIEVYGVNFDFDKAVLRPDSEPVLKQVLALFSGNPGYSAEVSGHTDNVGTPAYNLKLSEARAAAVKAWLVAHGIAASRITTRGYGDTVPLVPNTSDANRFKNRRVELHRSNCG